MDIFETAVKRILRWEPSVQVRINQNPEQILRNIYWVEPRLIYYISRCEISAGPFGYTFTFTYRNRDYPLEMIHMPQEKEILNLLRLTVAENQFQCVLCLPNSTDVRGILHRHHNQLTAVYPNLISYSLTSEQHPCSLHTIYVVKFQYRIGTVMLRQMELAVEREIRRLAGLLFMPDMPEIVKCFIAHNYLATTIRYQDEDQGSPLERSYLQSAYGALINKRCVCHGYAEAFKRLLNEAGIRCDIVLGQTNHTRDSWHAWNLVYLQDGKYCFHTDVTWDSRSALADKRYFCRGDAFMEQDHCWDRSHYPPSDTNPEGLSPGTQATMYCFKNKKKLLAAGLQPEWIS